MASNTQNTPCLKPELCGVKSHRPGTVAECQKTNGHGQRGPGKNTLAASPKLASLDALEGGRVIEFDDEEYADIDVIDNDIIESLEARMVTDEKDYVFARVVAETSIDFHRQLPDHWSKKQKDEFLNENADKIDKFLADRYGIVDSNGDDWDYQRVQFVAEVVPDEETDPITEGQVFSAAWDDTKIVQLHNELDRGTFGTENFDRLFAEALDVPERDERYEPSLTEVMTDLDKVGADLSDTDISFNFDKGEHQIDTDVQLHSLRDWDRDFKEYKRRVAFSGAWTGEEEEFQRLQYTGNRYAQSLGADEGGYAYTHDGKTRLRAKFIGSKNLAPFMRKHQDL